MVSESAPEVYCYVSVVSESVLAVFCYGCMVFVIAIIMVSESVPAAFCYGCMVPESVPAVFVMAIWFQRVCLQFVVMAIMVSESVPAFPPPLPHGSVVSERMHSYCNSYKWMSLQLR